MIWRSKASPRSLGSLYCGTTSGEKGWRIRLSQPRLRGGVEVGAMSWAKMPSAIRSIRRSKIKRRFINGLKQRRKLSGLQRSEERRVGKESRTRWERGE